MGPTLPDAWHEVEDPGHVAEQFRAANPTLFVREGEPVGVQVLPVFTSSPHDPERFGTDLVVGGPEDVEREVRVDTFRGRRAAYECALALAERFEAEYEGADPETALERAARRAD
ncbi:MAG: hypothetical protein ABEJ42_03680 [Halobacteriaceae archaeon]